MNSDGYFYFLNALSILYSKLIPITSHNMIKMGGVIQGELIWSVLKISGVINFLYLLENLHACLVHVHYMTLDISKI